MATKNFAIIGVAGYIAPRHLRAIKETGNRVVAALDPHDSVGVLDAYGDEISFFTEFERLDRHLEKLRRSGSEDTRVHYVSICSPNYLHDAHARFGLRVGAHVLCEKPLTLNPWNLESLQELERECGGRVHAVLQLRHHPKIIELKDRFCKSARKHQVDLVYITSRGQWYHTTWKGRVEQSGGIATNIGVHFFDMLLWVFGEANRVEVHYADPFRMAGAIELARANVRWFLSIESNDLPREVRRDGQRTFRSITVDDKEVDFTHGFTDLHNVVYERVLAGEGFGLDAALPAIDLVYKIRNAEPKLGEERDAHPWFQKLNRDEWVRRFWVPR